MTPRAAVRIFVLGLVGLGILGGVGCPGPAHNDEPLGAVLTASSEADLRADLGIPPGARSVLILSQTAHWDIDWLMTFDEYYTKYVDPSIRKALDLLQSDPDFYYSVSEIAFLRHYWDLHPEDRARMHLLARRGRLRIVGGGMTSPDTLLPGEESLLRDWERGTRWVEQNLGVRPRVAWQPDSFGHTPDLPSLLESLGYEGVAFARVDGGPTVGFGLTDAPPYPPGSDADFLIDVTHSIDFVWEAPDRASVLAHWMAYNLYCQGDTIDGTAFTVYGLHFDTPATEGVTNAAIARYADELGPVSPTGYMFVPVGCDFQEPKPFLTQYVRTWNRDAYPLTGTYAVVATFDDYVRFLGFHRSALPDLPMDLTPYFMGYYASRPLLKVLHEETEATLLEAERFWVLAERGGASAPVGDLGDAWDKFLPSNHHDWITGTSPDPVYLQEQVPVLEGALSAAQGLRDRAAQSVAAAIALPASPSGDALAVLNPSGFGRSGLVETPVSFAHGGAFSVAVEPADGGSPAPVQVVPTSSWPDGSIATADVLFEASDVPSLGYRTFLVSGLPATAPAPPQPAAASTSLGGVTLTSGACTARLSDADGTLTDFSCNGQDLVRAGSNALVYDQDDGGLYRLGHEMRGCGFQEVTAPLTGTVRTIVENGPLRATVRYTSIDRVGGTVTRTYSMEFGAARLDMTTTLAAPEGDSVDARFWTPVTAPVGVFSTPTGLVVRPAWKIFRPAYWPSQQWTSLLSAWGTGLTFLSPTDRSWRYDADARVETMLVRDTPREACATLGAGGKDPSLHTLVYSIIPAGPAWVQAPPPPRQAEALAMPLVTVPVTRGTGGGPLPPNYSLLSFQPSGVACPSCAVAPGLDPCRIAFCPADGSGGGAWVMLTALKDADDGGGAVARWLSPGGPGGTLALQGPLSSRPLRAADVREDRGGTLAPEAIPFNASITGAWIGPRE